MLLPLLSHPVRGAWIEIDVGTDDADSSSSHPVRGAWIEMRCFLSQINLIGESHPVRGAWIEMPTLYAIVGVLIVAPRQGCVD